jgi:hypothetical protein
MAALNLLCGSSGHDYDKRTRATASFLHPFICCDYRATSNIIVSELQETSIAGNKEKAKLFLPAAKTH